MLTNLTERHCIQQFETRGGNPTPLGGTFTLAGPGGAGPSTGPLAFDATALEVKAELESLPTVGIVDVSRDGPWHDGQGQARYVWQVTFRQRTGPLLHLSPDVSSMTGTTPKILEIKLSCSVINRSKSFSLLTFIISLVRLEA